MIDHHPDEEIEARFVDHREQADATATILTEYVRGLDVERDVDPGTALLFAIRRETLGFLRGVTSDEYDAAGWLHEHPDGALLRTLSTPSVTGATIDASDARQLYVNYPQGIFLSSVLSHPYVRFRSIAA